MVNKMIDKGYAPGFPLGRYYRGMEQHHACGNNRAENKRGYCKICGEYGGGFMQLIFEKGRTGRNGFKIQKTDVPVKTSIPANLQRKTDNNLPEVSELDVVRHYTSLANKNFCVDTNFYPLGSCTMKYNPKFTEICGLPGFKTCTLFAATLWRRDIDTGALELCTIWRNFFAR